MVGIEPLLSQVVKLFSVLLRERKVVALLARILDGK
uniref:Uncharacterized protein n=1 Tax=Rhizophora mucronata TaxID=61149 RepID=A0A2P2PKQ5_RHIMU